MTMYPIRSSNSSAEFFVLRAKGILNHQAGDQAGKEIELTYSMVRGMTDSGMPMWSTSDYDPIGFNHYHNALEALKRMQVGSGWNFTMIPGTGVIRKRTVKKVEEVNEWDV